MEKFARISRLTDQYLHGKLQKLVVKYETPTNVHLSILYEDTHDYWFDYELDLNMVSHQIDFYSHKLSSTIDKIQISRDEQFETALQELFS